MFKSPLKQKKYLQNNKTCLFSIWHTIFLFKNDQGYHMCQANWKFEMILFFICHLYDKNILCFALLINEKEQEKQYR